MSCDSCDANNRDDCDGRRQSWDSNVVVCSCDCRMPLTTHEIRKLREILEENGK